MNPPVTKGTAEKSVPATWRLPRAPLWVVAGFLAGTAFLLVVAAILEARARSELARGLAQSGVPAAASYGMLVQSVIDEQRLVPFILANDPDVIAALSASPGEKPAALESARGVLNQKLTILKQGALAEVIYVLDARGICIAASNAGQKDSFVGTDYAFRPYFTLARRSGDAEYFAVGIITHLPGLFVAHAVTVHGKFLGAVVDKLDFRDVEADWAQQGELVFVVNESGIVILTDVPAWRYHTLGGLPEQLRQKLQQSKQFGTAPLTPLPLVALSGGLVRMPDGQEAVPVESVIPARGWTVVLLARLRPQLSAAEREADLSAALMTAVLAALVYALRARFKSYMDQKARTEAIQRLANTDALTELPNRRALSASLERQWAGQAVAGGWLSIILIDVDYFKLFNDLYGHPAGDECLREVAKVLREVAQRPGDLVARYGGEEFILLLPHTSAEGARHVAENIMHRMRQARMAHAASPLGMLTLSAGVATILPGPECGPSSLIAAADAALYEAKRRGRDQVVCAEGCDGAAPGAA